MLATLCLLSDGVVVPSVTAPRGTTLLRAGTPVAAGGGGSKPVRYKDREDRRRQALQVGTNWPPRTDPIAGKGYFFFQGPTPKTAVQADLPNFFSAENFAGIEISPTQLAVTATGFASAAIIALSLASSTAPAVKMTAAPPAAEKKAPAPEKKKEEPKPAAQPEAKAPAPAARAPSRKASVRIRPWGGGLGLERTAACVS